MNHSESRIKDQTIYHGVKNSFKTAMRTPFQFGVTGLLFADALLGFIVVILSHWLSPAYTNFFVRLVTLDPHLSLMNTAMLYAMAFSLVTHVFGLHDPIYREQISIVLAKAIGAAIGSLILLTLVMWFVFYAPVGRYVMAYTFVLSSVGLPALRWLMWLISNQTKKRLLVVGANKVGLRVVHLINEHKSPYEVVAFCESDPEFSEKTFCDRPVLDGEVPLHIHCLQYSIHEVVVCVSKWPSEQHLREVLKCMPLGIQVRDYPSFVEHNFFRIPVEHLDPSWFFQLNTSGDYFIFQSIKRMIDIVTAGGGLLLTSPILLLSAILIKVESRGPVFYSQVRVGYCSRHFHILKLRSMRTDAEADGPQWANKNDRRATRIGKLMRKTRVDEIPQFWNILRGDMSFVGPRPERPQFVSELAAEIPYYEQRHLVKPGITGWAQINYPYGASKTDSLNKLKYDLYYVRNASILLDLHITLRTIGAVMNGAR